MNLKKICKNIGCSGVNKQCPGNKNCEIIIKLLSNKNKAVEALIGSEE